MFDCLKPIRRVALLLIITAFFVPGLARATAADDKVGYQEENVPTYLRRSDWRSALHSEFRYTSTPGAPYVLSTNASTLILDDPVSVDLRAQVGKDKNAVAGERYEELEYEFAQQKLEAKEKEFNKRFGIGFHGYANRSFAIGVYTVLYVPVFAGFGFSW